MGWFNITTAWKGTRKRVYYDLIICNGFIPLVPEHAAHSLIHPGINRPLQWRHNGHDSVSNHQPHDCLLNRLFRRRSKKTSKLRVTGLCVGNSSGTGDFPAQMASNAGYETFASFPNSEWLNMWYSTFPFDPCSKMSYHQISRNPVAPFTNMV